MTDEPKKYRLETLSHLGQMYDAETMEEADFPSGTLFYLVSEVDQCLVQIKTATDFLLVELKSLKDSYDPT
jgi:hypothetical protein